MINKNITTIMILVCFRKISNMKKLSYVATKKANLVFAFYL